MHRLTLVAVIHVRMIDPRTGSSREIWPYYTQILPRCNAYLPFNGATMKRLPMLLDHPFLPMPFPPQHILSPVTLSSPTRLPHTRDIALQRIHPKWILFSSAPMSPTSPPLLTRPTLAMRKSLNTPLPLPPSIHRFRICVGLV